MKKIIISAFFALSAFTFCAQTILTIGAHSEFNKPSDVAVDKNGILYVADAGNNRVCKIDKAGKITTIAGNGKVGYSGDDGPAVKASFDNPVSIALDDSGNVFVADNKNNVIRKINAKGIITTVAGNGKQGFRGDEGFAVNAEFDHPVDVALDAVENIYVADYGNFRVRKISKAGTIRTIAGNGKFGYAGDTDEATEVPVEPAGIAVDNNNDLYISDINNDVIRKVDFISGKIFTIAGTGKKGEAKNNSRAIRSPLYDPSGIDIDKEGNIYVPESEENAVKKIDKYGVITTVAGNSGADSIISIELKNPTAVAIDEESGDIYIADRDNNCIRKIVSGKTASDSRGMPAWQLKSSK